MVLSEKIVNTDKFGGIVDIITGIEDFEHTCTFDEEWHCFKYDGRILPSVTKILDDGSYDNINPEILKRACERGKLIHKEIEMYLKYAENGFTDEFYEFLNIYTEEQEKFKEKAIFDIKTFAIASKKNREKCLKQEKMYAEAIKFLTGEKIEKFYMIHLPKNKKGKLINLEEE